jgi:hypothetical protein
MLHLPDNLLVASGNRRMVFMHPGNPERCLKTAKPGSTPAEIRRRKRWYKRLRPDHSYDDNRIEICEFARLSRHVSNPAFGLPWMYGIVATDRGLALEQDFIRNPDGSIAPNLSEVLAAARDDLELRSRVRASLPAFTDWLASNRIVVHDLHPRNLVVRREVDVLRPILIDGLGAYSLVPFEHLLPHPVALWRLSGKIRRFYRIVDAALADESREVADVPA